MSSSESILETAFTSDFVDDHGATIQHYEFSFTSETSNIPSHGIVAKIMAEISKILPSIEGSDRPAASSRNCLKFTLDNSKRPPLTFKFVCNASSVPPCHSWYESAGDIMEIIARLSVDEKSVIQPYKSPTKPESISRHNSMTSNSIPKIYTPCTFPQLADVKNYLKSANSQCIVYVPLEKTMDLMPAVISSYPLNGDDDLINCRLGLWKGASEITCRISELFLMKEIPIDSKMKVFANPPASLPDFDQGLKEYQMAEFVGIVDVIMAQGKAVERLKVRYAKQKREDEIPLFRATLYRGETVSEILEKRLLQDKFRLDLIDEMNNKKSRVSSGGRGSKRAIAERKESPEVGGGDRRKSSRVERNSLPRRSSPIVADPDDGVMEVLEEPDEAQLKENSVNTPDVKGASNSTSTRSERKRSRNSLIGQEMSSPVRSELHNKTSLVTSAQPNRGNIRKRRNSLADTVPISDNPLANLFSEQIFMVLNSCERSTSPPGDELKSVEMIERLIRQCDGEVVDLPFCGPPEALTNLTVICKQQAKSFKYLYALAAAIPIVSYDWVNACMSSSCLVDKTDYLLPSYTYDDGRVLKQRAAHSRLFDGNKIFIAARCKQFYNTWQSLLQVSGAFSVPAINSSIKRHRSDAVKEEDIEVEATKQEAECLIPECEYVLIEPDPECAPIYEVVSTALNENVPMVTTKWVIECIINGRTIDPTDNVSTFIWRK